MRALVVVPCLFLAACVSSQPALRVAPGQVDERVDIDVDGLDLAVVMDDLGRRVGSTILVDRSVQETVCVSLRDVPWREAVEVIARMCRCEVDERAGGVLVLTQVGHFTIQDASTVPARTVVQLLAAHAGCTIELPPGFDGRFESDTIEGTSPRELLRRLVAEVGPYDVEEVSWDRLRVVRARELRAVGRVLGHAGDTVAFQGDDGAALELRLPPPSASGPEGARREALLRGLSAVREGDRVAVRIERCAGAWWLRDFVE